MHTSLHPFPFSYFFWLSSKSINYFYFSWLPEHVTLLARFSGEPSPVKSAVTKAVAEFRRTHADTWNVQKELFTEEQLEVTSKMEKLNIILYLLLIYKS